MTIGRAVVGILVGLVAGVMSGLFGVGGGIVTTPAIQFLLGGAPYVALGTPLPVIFPTALVGAWTYHRGGEVSMRAAAWAAGPGVVGSVGGAALTSRIDPHWLLLVTAVLIVWQAVRVGRGGDYRIRPRGSTPGWEYALLGLVTGFVSGLLGVGGGIVFVPLVTTLLGMPLKRALGTSLVVIAAVAIPGTIVHAALGHIDWTLVAVFAATSVPLSFAGARVALRIDAQRLEQIYGAVLVLLGATFLLLR